MEKSPSQNSTSSKLTESQTHPESNVGMRTTLKCEYLVGLGFQSYTYSLGVVVVVMEDIALLRNVELSKMPPRRRDWKKRKPPPGRRGTRSSGARKYTAVEAARARIIVASEDFAPLPLLCPVGL